MTSLKSDVDMDDGSYSDTTEEWNSTTSSSDDENNDDYDSDLDWGWRETEDDGESEDFLPGDEELLAELEEIRVMQKEELFSLRMY